MSSPLFGTSSEERAQLLRYKYCATLVQPTITNPFSGCNYGISLLTTSVTWDNVSPEFFEVDSVEEAEDLLFSGAAKATEPWDGLPFALRRQAAYLAHRNRRGYANLLFMSPSMWEKLPKDQLFLDWNEFGTQHGRWFYRGILRKFDNSGSRIFTCDSVPENTAYVAYKGLSDVDAVAHLFFKSGEMRLWCPHSVDFVAGCEHYITQVLFD